MPTNENTASRIAFVVIDPTAIPHPCSAWLDENGHAVTFDTEHEAQIEIAEWMIDKISEFIAGERDFEDAISCSDIVVEVDLRVGNTPK